MRPKQFRLRAFYLLIENGFDRFRPLSTLLVTVVLFAVPSFSSAQQIGVKIDEDPDRPWHFEADEIGYNAATGHYIAKGNVTISKKDVMLSADYVRFDQKAMKALAIGNVTMTAGRDIMIGNSMEIDLVTQTGTIYQGSVFLQENHFYIKGDKLQKTGKHSYAAEKASISSCDGDPPAWKITGRNLNVRLEGYGTVKHGALWAKKVPVLYSPYLVFPTKRKRQTGFLPPQFGDSSRNGFYYVQPFFWAINESQDATFYWNYIAERGQKVGGEYRYVLDPKSKGTIMYDFLDDQKIDDGTDDSSEKWGFTDDNVLRPNSDRYWFRMKGNQLLPYDFSAKLDLDIVSDQDYLLEFRTGETGFQWTNDYFVETFGRGLDDYNDPVRKNQLSVNRRWDKYNLNAEALWYDDVVLRRQFDTNPTLQRLPAIDFDGSRQRIFSTPLYFKFNTEYVYFYRQDGPTSQRADLFPRFYAPLRVKNYFTFEPSLGLRETLYYNDRLVNPDPDTERFQSREIWDVTADFFTEVFNVFRLNIAGIDRIKHTVRPRLDYTFTPDVDQSDLPFFDSEDRIGEQNLLTYSLTNTLTSRRRKRISNKEESGEAEKADAYDYRQFFRFKLEQSYNIKTALDHKPQPFSLVTGRIDFVPLDYVSLELDGKWSPYEHDLVEHNLALTLKDKRGDRLLVQRRYTEASSESISFDAQAKITDNLTVYGDYAFNQLDDIRIRSSIGGRYIAQCWSLDVRYVDDGTDRRYEFIIALQGLGRYMRSLAGGAVENPISSL